MKIGLLLYCCILAIIADSEEDLQSLLNILEKWWNQWHRPVNIKTKSYSSQVIKPRTDFMFNNEIV